jgi:hypothetical protein
MMIPFALFRALWFGVPAVVEYLTPKPKGKPLELTGEIEQSWVARGVFLVIIVVVVALAWRILP